MLLLCITREKSHIIHSPYIYATYYTNTVPIHTKLTIYPVQQFNQVLQSLEGEYATLWEQYEQLRVKSREVIATLQKERDQKIAECENLSLQVSALVHCNVIKKTEWSKRKATNKQKFYVSKKRQDGDGCIMVHTLSHSL